MPLPVVMIFLIHSSGSSPVLLPPLSLNRALSSLTQVPQVDSTYRTLSLSQILLRSSRLPQLFLAGIRDSGVYVIDCRSFCLIPPVPLLDVSLDVLQFIFCFSEGQWSVVW